MRIRLRIDWKRQIRSAAFRQDTSLIVPAHNPEIAQGLDDIADLLELEDANPFRVRAYRNAARVVRRDQSGLRSTWR
jgi:hypothetical protein